MGSEDHLGSKQFTDPLLVISAMPTTIICADIYTHILITWLDIDNKQIKCFCGTKES